MKLAEVQFKDMSAMGGLPGATSMLTAENEPELDEHGWVRFKDRAGNWHRVPADLVRRVTEVAPNADVAQGVQLAAEGQQKRGPGRPAKTV